MELFGLLLTLLPSLTLVGAKRDQALYCGACIGLMEEMDWGLMLTDDKKKLQVGSFRIDSHGRQNLHEVPLKKTELHLTETLEKSCNELGRYGKVTNKDKNIINYVRTDSRDGTPISMKNINIENDTQKLLKFACDALVEEFEEEIIAMYQEEVSERREKVCIEIAGLCVASNFTDQLWAHSEVIFQGMEEWKVNATLKAEEEEQHKEDLRNERKWQKQQVKKQHAQEEKERKAKEAGNESQTGSDPKDDGKGTDTVKDAGKSTHDIQDDTSASIKEEL